MRIGFCADPDGVALVVPRFRLRERHLASSSRASQGDRESWAKEGGAIPKGGSVGSRHEETVIVQVQSNISTVTFPISEVYKASWGAARTSVGHSEYAR
jgi:hypothetical protein